MTSTPPAICHGTSSMRQRRWCACAGQSPLKSGRSSAPRVITPTPLLRRPGPTLPPARSWPLHSASGSALRPTNSMPWRGFDSTPPRHPSCGTPLARCSLPHSPDRSPPTAVISVPSKPRGTTGCGSAMLHPPVLHSGRHPVQSWRCSAAVCSLLLCSPPPACLIG